jgi:hypothetical protein
MMKQFSRTPINRLGDRRAKSFIRGTGGPAGIRGPVGLSISLVKIKDGMRRDFGLAPALPENIINSCIDYGLQKYSSDCWFAIEFVRIVQELPEAPPWLKIGAALFGIGAGLQGAIDIRDGLAGKPRQQTLASFTTPEFQFPRGFTLAWPTYPASQADK